jgi:energy-coupling factor transport system substrate-specific component
VLGGLIIRKPGAAVYTEVVAGDRLGAHRNAVGLAHHRGRDRAGARRRTRLRACSCTATGGSPSRCSRARAPGLAMAINDLVIWYAGAAPTFATIYLISAVDRRCRARRRPGVARDARPRSRRRPRPVRRGT